MSNIILPNGTPSVNTRAVDAVWTLTRAMKKAGWTVLGSSFGNTPAQKYTTGRYADSIASGSGAAISASAPDALRMTLTGLTGMKPRNCGDFLETSGAANGANNGAFVISEVLSATSVNVINSARVVPDAGSISWVLRPFIPEIEDIWSLGTNIANSTAASLAAGSTPDRMTINSLTGMTAADVGNYITITGASTGANNGTWLIIRVLSSTSVEVLARANASPYTGSITWTKKNGTGASQATGSAASITTKTETSDWDFTVTGLVHSATNSGAAGAIGAALSYNTLQINNLSGMSTVDVGKWLTVSGASDSSNNGEFLIVGYVSASSVIVLNPNRVGSGAGTLAWSVRQGPEEGNYLCLSGASSTRNNGIFQIVRTLSATSCVIRNRVGTINDANNGSISWNHRDPTKSTLADLYTAGFDRAAWIMMQGPGLIRMPFTGGISSAEAFLRGEKVVQVNTGAEGELVGITFDSTGAGWAVVATQVQGSGTDYDDGWDLTIIQGASSTASFVPTGIQEFDREVVFATRDAAADYTKAGYIVINYTQKDTEQRQRLWVRSLNAACTAVIPPGYSNVADTDGNTFPARAYAALGNYGTATVTYWHVVFNDPAVSVLNKFQAVAANAIRRRNQSPDGTFWTHQWANGLGVAGGFGFHRLDDTEEGEVDPWAFGAITDGGGARETPARVTAHNAIAALNVYHSQQFLGGTTATRTSWRASRGRGTGGGGESPCVGLIGGGLVIYYNSTFSGLSVVGAANTGTFAETIQSAQGTKFLMEKIMLVHSTAATTRFRKGTLRWARLVQSIGKVVFDTLSNKTWMVAATGSTTGDLLPCVLGPWDGLTAPTGT